MCSKSLKAAPMSNRPKILGELEPSYEISQLTPDWAKTLLLMLDYAIVEAIEHDLAEVRHHLEMARSQLDGFVRNI